MVPTSMSVRSTRASIEVINRNLQEIEERREKLIKETREIIMLCSKSIVALHQDNAQEARQQMQKAKSLLDELRKYSKADLQRHIAVAEQELVEAYGLMAVVKQDPLPTMEELNVSGPSYLTGLLDCIGEIKRLVYDRMRSGREKDAENLFAIMEEIYNATAPFAVYDNLVSGIRRKLDVARMLIEDIRAVVTEEKRRTALITAVESLQKKLDKV